MEKTMEKNHNYENSNLQVQFHDRLGRAGMGFLFMFTSRSKAGKFKIHLCTKPIITHQADGIPKLKFRFC